MHTSLSAWGAGSGEDKRGLRGRDGRRGERKDGSGNVSANGDGSRNESRDAHPKFFALRAVKDCRARGCSDVVWRLLPHILGHPRAHLSRLMGCHWECLHGQHLEAQAAPGLLFPESLSQLLLRAGAGQSRGHQGLSRGWAAAASAPTSAPSSPDGPSVPQERGSPRALPGLPLRLPEVPAARPEGWLPFETPPGTPFGPSLEDPHGMPQPSCCTAVAPPVTAAVSAPPGALGQRRGHGAGLHVLLPQGWLQRCSRPLLPAG